MKEREFIEQFNNDIDKIAPDILDKILAQPIEPVKSEKELFGKNRPLFKEKAKITKMVWVPVGALAMAACFMVAIMLGVFNPNVGNSPVNTQTACAVYVDVNPSIQIDLDKNGYVIDVIAGNDDAKNIVEIVNKKRGDNNDYEYTMSLIVKNLKKNGYLQKKTKAMLVSFAKNDDTSKEDLNYIKLATSNAKRENKIDAPTLYQKIKVTKKVEQVAEDNEVSVGKAALCLKLSKDNKKDAGKMCNKSIKELVSKAKSDNLYEDDDDIDYVEIEAEEETSYEDESYTDEYGIYEDESYTDEYIDETQSQIDDVTENVDVVDETAGETEATQEPEVN